MKIMYLIVTSLRQASRARVPARKYLCHLFTVRPLCSRGRASTKLRACARKSRFPTRAGAQARDRVGGGCAAGSRRGRGCAGATALESRTPARFTASASASASGIGLPATQKGKSRARAREALPKRLVKDRARCPLSKKGGVACAYARARKKRLRIRAEKFGHFPTLFLILAFFGLYCM